LIVACRQHEPVAEPVDRATLEVQECEPGISDARQVDTEAVDEP
jgi:hypothetical protein